MDAPDAGAIPDAGVTLSPVTCQPNLAFHASPITYVNSSEDQTWGAAKVVDGVTDSIPESGGYSTLHHNPPSNPNNDPRWISIDLGAPRTFDTVVLYPRNYPGFVGDGFPINFTIKVWNGTEWLTRITRKGYPKPGNTPQIFKWDTPDTASKVWIEATNLRNIGPEYLLQFAEIQVSDSMSEIKPESNQLLGARVTAGSFHDNTIEYGWTPSNVVDGKTAVAHAGYSSSLYNQTNTVFNPHTEWLEISLPCRKTLSKIVLYPRNHPGYVDNGFPEDFSISFWNGTDWDKKVDETGYKLPGGAAQTFSWGSSYTTDKIRIDATKLRNRENGWYLFQLSEVEAYP